jgi:hypothetical protein
VCSSGILAHGLPLLVLFLYGFAFMSCEVFPLTFSGSDYLELMLFLL